MEMASNLQQALLNNAELSDAELFELLKGHLQEWKANWRSSLPFFRWMAQEKLGRPASQAIKLLHEQRVPVTPFHTSIAITACNHPGGWQLALWTLFSMMQMSGQIDVVVYNSAINVCKAGGLWQAAAALICDMTQRSMACNPRTCSAAISACGKASEWQAALAILHSMDTLGVETELFSFTAAMKACAGQARWETALDLWQNLEQRSHTPAEVTYNTLVSTCGSTSGWQQALEILNMAIEAGQCSAVTCNAASFACGEAGMWRSSLSILDDMELLHHEPDRRSFNTAITACGRSHEWQRAVELLQNLGDRARLGVDHISLAATISACDMGGQWQLAILLLDESIRSRMLTPQCFTSAISACEGDWERALSLFKDMRQLTLQQGPKSFGAVITACSRRSRWAVAVALLLQMSKQDLVPSGCHIGSIAEALTQLNAEATADQLLEEFREKWLTRESAGANTLSEDASRLATCGLTVLAIGCGIVALEKPAGKRTEALFQDAKEALKLCGLSKASLVSRLDLPTSGVLPLVLDHADSPLASWYRACFAGRLVTKQYLCLCEGPSLGPVGFKGHINMPLSTKQLSDGGLLAVVSETGRAARTEYEVIRRFRSERIEMDSWRDQRSQVELMLLQVHPVTGRTHQIRAHLAELGRPLVGDATYGSADSAARISAHRLFLHCHRVSMQDFEGQTFSAVSNLPDDLKDCLSDLEETCRHADHKD